MFFLGKPPKFRKPLNLPGLPNESANVDLLINWFRICRKTIQIFSKFQVPHPEQLPPELGLSAVLSY